MKKLHVIKSLLGCGLILGVLLIACSKDRVTQDAYSPMDAFYNKYKQQEQDFVVDTGPGPCLLVGKMGTKLYNICDSSQFTLVANGSHITYPYHIKLVEIYNAKDMILWPMPTLAGSQVLETAAGIRVRAVKGADDYALSAGREYDAVLNDSIYNTIVMNAYHGTESTNNVDWAAEPLTKVAKAPLFDSLNVVNMGWVSGARPHASTGTGVLTVTVAGTGTDNIGIFIVFKNFKSVMKVNHLVSGPIPVNEPFTFIAMAFNQNNQYVLDRRDLTLTGNQNISLSFQAVSETDLINMLSGL